MATAVNGPKRAGVAKAQSNIVQKIKQLRNASLLVTCELDENLLAVPYLMAPLTARLEKSRDKSVFTGLSADDLVAHVSGQLPSLLIRPRQSGSGSAGPVPLPYSITWSRVDPRLPSNDDQEKISLDTVHEPDVLVLLMPDQIQSLVNSLGTVNKPNAFTQLKESIVELKGRPITCVIVTGGKRRRISQKRRSSSGNKPPAAPKQQLGSINQLCVALHLEAQVRSTRVCSSVNDAALVIASHTRSIAERPFKEGRLQQDEGACFLPQTVRMGLTSCASRGRGPGQAPANNGADDDPSDHLAQQAWANRVWLSQLGQWRGLTGEIAHAVSTTYPTARQFFMACRQPSTSSAVTTTSNQQQTSSPAQRFIKDLADLEIRRGAGVLTSRRRLGLEFARRLFTHFTCNEASQVIE